MEMVGGSHKQKVNTSFLVVWDAIQGKQNRNSDLRWYFW